MLQLHDLHAFHGASHVLHGVTLDVNPGEIVALLGRNGSGRSTTAQAVMGLVRTEGGATWKGEPLACLRPFEIARRGIGYVPEGRDVFPRLSVQQNLALGIKPGARRPRWSFEDMFALFPILRERRDAPAGALSGGEQQMLALCRSLMGDPELLVVDEPTEGLAPQVVAQVGRFLLALRERGVSVLLIEQKLAIALEVAQRCAVMGRGRVVFEGTPAQLRANAAVRRDWLEV